jgi:hypothetical protein
MGKDFWRNNDVLLRMRKHIMGMSKQARCAERSVLFFGQHFSDRHFILVGLLCELRLNLDSKFSSAFKEAGEDIKEDGDDRIYFATFRYFKDRTA